MSDKERSDEQRVKEIYPDAYMDIYGIAEKYWYRIIRTRELSPLLEVLR